MTIFSVASNRKTKSRLNTQTHTLRGGLESKGKKAILISYSVLFQVAMSVVPTVRRSQTRSLVGWEREVWGVGTHVRRCPRFLFSLMLRRYGLAAATRD